ncbi:MULTISPECIES: hypothetical protein [Bacillus]|uniref:hypothetical protein n=1 Tax=Bacillus TaxID=1386 RepID=UPI000BA8CF71|nr:MULTISPECIES: hypothetical protein [Bacillus]MBU2661865.1 hypothetical protein [Bacillus cabrialesii]PAO69934.1 hypothetical protein CIK44_04235 [Bacillus sp. X2(2017)]QXW84062.1 hypothetical protein KXZ66_22175 [Bacillus sp. LJBS17]
MTKNKLLNALTLFKSSAREISDLWFESDDVTYNNLNEGYPFDQDFCEVVEKIENWLITQRELFK